MAPGIAAGLLLLAVIATFLLTPPL